MGAVRVCEGTQQLSIAPEMKPSVRERMGVVAPRLRRVGVAQRFLDGVVVKGVCGAARVAVKRESKRSCLRGGLGSF